MQTAEANQELQLREQLTTVQLQSIVIKDQPTYDHAADVLVEIKTWRKKWADYWEEPRANAHKAWQGILGKFNDGDKAAANSEAIIKNKILQWDQQQAEIQRKAQEEADRIARAKEEAERAAKAAEMEVFEVSDSDIEEYLAAPSVAVAEVVPLAYVKASGISKRSNWKARVVNIKLLAKAVAAGKVPVDYILPNQSRLDSLAKANQSTLNVPGVEAYDDPIISGRAR